MPDGTGHAQSVGMVAHRITEFDVRAYRIPTETPESDGTLNWQSTTLILVTLSSGTETGLGYTYGNKGLRDFIGDLIKKGAVDEDAFQIEKIWGKLVRLIRNEGRTGEGSMAIAAIDNALWDLKAKLLNVPLGYLLGLSREKVEAYGSGGFTNYSMPQLENQIAAWREAGFKKVKIKIGAPPEVEFERLTHVRRWCGDGMKLFVDANEAYDLMTAREIADILKELNIGWFEQPIFAQDIEGMHDLKMQFPSGIYLTTGEYVYNVDDARRFLAGDAADVLQLDITRCEGLTGFLKCAHLCEAYNIPVSSHCAPALHVSPACSVAGLRHVEYFFDHARIEKRLFDGVPEPKAGWLTPDLGRNGHGLEFKFEDAERYAV